MGGPRIGRLKTEVIVERSFEVVIVAGPGVEFLGVARVDEDVSVGIVETREHHDAGATALELDQYRVLKSG